MEQSLFDFLMEIPLTISKLMSWLLSPISEKYLNISPLGLLGVAGTSILIGLIVTHVVKLFVG